MTSPFDLLEECMGTVFPWSKATYGFFEQEDNVRWYDIGDGMDVKAVFRDNPKDPALGLRLIPSAGLSLFGPEGVMRVPPPQKWEHHLKPHIIGWLSLARNEFNARTLRDRERGWVLLCKGRGFTKINDKNLNTPTVLMANQNTASILREEGGLWVWLHAGERQEGVSYPTYERAIEAYVDGLDVGFDSGSDRNR